MKHLKHIKVFSEDLEIGMFVSELDRPWQESSFLLQGFAIDNESDIEAVKQQCEFVFIDFRDDEQFQQYRLKASSSSTYLKQAETKQAKTKQTANSYNLRKKLKPALKRTQQTSHLINGVIDRIMLGEDFDLHTVRQSVKEDVKAVIENEEAMLMMTMLKSVNSDVTAHCFNVSILSIGFAKSLGYSESILEDIGMAALLHDVGHMKVDKAITDKKGKLNQIERKEMAKHTQFGSEILSTKKGLTPSCMDVVMSHHEHLDGNGYPRGLKEDQISNNVRLISIVDTFDSITSFQAYRKAHPVMDAYKVLMDGKNERFDETLVLKFIKWRSIYPPGSIVEMDNGEVGIVIKSNQEHKLKPRVLLVLNEYKQPRKERLIDMSKVDLDSESKPYRIIKAYENMAFGIDLQEYTEKGLKVQLPDS